MSDSHGGDISMFRLLPLPWFTKGSLRHRSREIATTIALHGLGWMVEQVGLSHLIPFERGWLCHPKRETPYTQAEHLRIALSELGVTFIKLGQVLSTRADLLPLQYIVQLAQLQDAAPTVPFEQICRIICDELGQSPETLFAEFDPHPLASTSLGRPSELVEGWAGISLSMPTHSMSSPL